MEEDMTGLEGWVCSEGSDPGLFFGSSLENQRLNLWFPEKWERSRSALEEGLSASDRAHGEVFDTPQDRTGPRHGSGGVLLIYRGVKLRCLRWSPKFGPDGKVWFCRSVGHRLPRSRAALSGRLRGF